MDAHSIHTNIQFFPVGQPQEIQTVNLVNKPPDNIEMILRNPNEDEVTVKQPFRSWSLNVIAAMARYSRGAAAGAVGAPQMLTTAGAARDDAKMSFWTCQAAAGDSSYGIVVGRGNTANTITSTPSLQYQYSHGTGASANTLSYGTNLVFEPIVQVSNSAWRYTIRRIFTNATASAMIVRETGVYVLDAQNSVRLMAARDLVDSSGSALGLTIAPAGVLEIRYNFYVDGTNGLTLNWLKCLYNAMTYQSAGGYQIPTMYNEVWAEGATGQWTKDLNFQGVQLMSTWRLMQAGGNWYGTDMGIIVGTSSTPFAIWNNRLAGGLFSNSGLTASQSGFSILYDQVFWGGISANSWSSISWSLYRCVTNNTISPITIREVGLCSPGDATDYRTGNEFLWLRQTTPDIVLSANQSTLVKFTFTTTM